VLGATDAELDGALDEVLTAVAVELDPATGVVFPPVWLMAIPPTANASTSAEPEMIAALRP
jgi:hypothetical protein